MKHHFIYIGIIVGMAIALMVTVITFSSEPKPFPAPILKAFEAQDGLHVLYREEDAVEDILIELVDEQELYYFDINGKQHSILLVRHCMIGECNVVDVSLDNGRMLCIPSHVRRANQK